MRLERGRRILPPCGEVVTIDVYIFGEIDFAGQLPNMGSNLSIPEFS